MGKLGDVGLLVCPICKEAIGVLLTTRNYKGEMQYKNEDAKPCEKCLKNSAKLICNDCNKLVAYIEPGKTQFGFDILPEINYHTTTCKKCSPDNEYFDIIEIVDFIKQQKERSENE